MGKYPQSAFLKWECGPTENTAYLSIDYEGGKLNMGAVVSGTPIIGTACAITVKARNFEYKTGGNEVQLRVNGGNFDVTQIIPVTPAEKYKGSICLKNLLSIHVCPVGVMALLDKYWQE